MTKIIEFVAGPGAGKSTTASGLFHLMKLQGYSVELVSEWVKRWAYEGKEVRPYDQAYIFAKQCKSEADLIGKVDYIITDSPVILTKHYGKDAAINMDSVVDDYLAWAESQGVVRYTLFLERNKEYKQEGRWQTEEEAIQIDHSLKKLIGSHTSIGGADCSRPRRILDILTSNQEESFRGYVPFNLEGKASL